MERKERKAGRQEGNEHLPLWGKHCVHWPLAFILVMVHYSCLWSIFLHCHRSSQDTQLASPKYKTDPFCLLPTQRLWTFLLDNAQSHPANSCVPCSNLHWNIISSFNMQWRRAGSQLSLWKLIMRSLISSDKDAFIYESAQLKAPKPDRYSMRQALPLLLVLIRVWSEWLLQSVKLPDFLMWTFYNNSYASHI